MTLCQRCQEALTGKYEVSRPIEPTADRNAIVARLMCAEMDRGDFAAALLRLTGPEMRERIAALVSEYDLCSRDVAAITGRVMSLIEQTAEGTQTGESR